MKNIIISGLLIILVALAQIPVSNADLFSSFLNPPSFDLSNPLGAAATIGQQVATIGQQVATIGQQASAIGQQAVKNAINTTSNVAARASSTATDVQNSIKNKLLQAQVRTAAVEEKVKTNVAVNAGVAKIKAQATALKIKKSTQTVQNNIAANRGLIELQSYINQVPEAARDCYRDHDFNFNGAINDAKTKAEACLNNKLKSVDSTVSKSTTNIQNYRNKLSNPDLLIGNCNTKNTTEQTTCLNNAIASIKNNTDSNVKNIGNQVDSTVKSINSVQSTLVACQNEITSVVNKKRIEAQEVAEKCEEATTTTSTTESSTTSTTQESTSTTAESTSTTEESTSTTQESTSTTEESTSTTSDSS